MENTPDLSMTTQTGSPGSAVSPTDLPQLADEQLTLQEQDEVQRLVEQIDITDPVLSIAYAAKP